MDLGSILLISGILILVILFISQPFIRRTPSRIINGERQLSSLMAEQDQIINALLELDFDYHLGKIPEEDYPTQRGTLLARGAQVMKQMDTLRINSEAGNGASKLVSSGTVLQTKSSAASVRKERGTKRPLKTPDDDLEILLAARRRERGEKAGGFCPQCGNPIQQSDRFCSRCGEALSPGENSQ